MTVKPPCICRYYKIKTKGTHNTNPTKRINEKYPLLLCVFLSRWNSNGRNRNSDRDRGQELPAENSNEESFGKEAIFATRFLDAVSQQLSSHRSNKRSSARRRVSDEFPVSASHSHSPPQQALPPPHVLCHGFNNAAAVVDGSCSCSCSATCFVCVRVERLVMSSTILCFDGK